MDETTGTVSPGAKRAGAELAQRRAARPHLRRRDAHRGCAGRPGRYTRAVDQRRLAEVAIGKTKARTDIVKPLVEFDKMGKKA
jgi:hypothetical protein